MRRRQEGLEKDNTLWLPLIEGKGQKEKKKTIKQNIPYIIDEDLQTNFDLETDFLRYRSRLGIYLTLVVSVAVLSRCVLGFVFFKLISRPNIFLTCCFD